MFRSNGNKCFVRFCQISIDFLQKLTFFSFELGLKQKKVSARSHTFDQWMKCIDPSNWTFFTVGQSTNSRRKKLFNENHSSYFHRRERKRRKSLTKNVISANDMKFLIKIYLLSYIIGLASYWNWPKMKWQCDWRLWERTIDFKNKRRSITCQFLSSNNQNDNSYLKFFLARKREWQRKNNVICWWQCACEEEEKNTNANESCVDWVVFNC